MALHKDLSGSDLHNPKGKYPDFLDLDDNQSEAFKVYEDGGDDDYILISTSNGAEKITLGNTDTDPTVDVRGGHITTSNAAVAHGVTNVAATDAYGDIGPIHATYGGLMINGISDQESADARSLALRGISNDTHTDTVPLVEIIGAKRSGASVQALADAETVLTVANHTSTKLAVLGSGNTGIGTTAPDKVLEVNSSDGNNLRLTYNDSNGSAATYADLQVSSTGYVAIRNSAAKGGTLITKCVPQAVATAGNVTYSAAQLLSGYILRDPAGSSRSDVTPTALLIVAAIPNAAANDSFKFMIKNTADASEPITLTGGSGVTIVGTATIAQGNTKEFLCVITDTDGTADVYSLGTWTH